MEKIFKKKTREEKVDNIRTKSKCYKEKLVQIFSHAEGSVLIFFWKYKSYMYSFSFSDKVPPFLRKIREKDG